ncbi:MAG TPA: MFS transporter [Candidatus Dormibacteraeota bacterium]|nr:MFS transporter [Candidatus Dormibacteraeota bacterium]
MTKPHAQPVPTEAPAAGPALAASPVWEPLRQPLFRALWLAALASNVGTWMQDVGATWLMTSLTTSPILIALIQAATTLPVFLLALVAGALADVVDRRRLLIVTQSWMLLASAALGALTVLGLAKAWVLLLFTFLVGTGNALNAPAWQAIIPELVGRRDLPSALALNGISVNLARAVGPAVAGLILAAAGPGATFLLNAVSFLGVVVVLFRWKRPPRQSLLPAETLLGALLAGMRYARHAPDLHAVLLRSSAFIVCGISMFALLPVLLRFQLGCGPTAYGLVLGCFGLGAVAGALLLPRLRQALSFDRLAQAASLLFGLILGGLAFAESYALVCLLMTLGGAAWIALLTTFHTSAQASLAPWVRGRGLAVYLLVFFGGMAGGSALWGAVATHLGLRAALVLAGAMTILGVPATVRFRLRRGEAPDLAPSRHWPARVVVGEPDADHGPVLITVEYRVDPDRAEDFSRAMRDVRRIRLRDGAFRWDLLSDPADPGRYVESFLVESWIEHLRQHERVTVADREVEDRARLYHLGPGPPVVSHFVSRDLPR